MLKFRRQPAGTAIAVVLLAGAGMLTPSSAPVAEEIEELIVFGRAQEQIGTAGAASEGTVGGADLAIRPLLQVAELLEAAPGMVAVQHSGSGKANQYFMRGFNLDHGTDFTNHVDGVPLNFRSHGHGQGYLDVNGLIPETVDRIDFRKGTYRADLGDFSMAGAAFMRTVDRLATRFVSLEGGSYDWRRIAAGGTQDVAGGTITGMAQYKAYDGPWELEEDLNHKSVWGKYLRDLDFGTLRVSLSGYSGRWKPTEQIPEAAIGSAFCENEFCTLEPTSKGRTDRWILGAELTGGDWDALLYAQTYDWEMSSNPTYDEQVNQFDERHVFGGRLQREFPLGDRVLAMAGGEFRYDDIRRVGVDFYENGSFLAPNGDNRIEEASVGAYAELLREVTDRLRLTPGLRADYYSFDVRARNELSAHGKASDRIVSPKLSVAYALTDALETYANWGHGFHSNDARGTVDAQHLVEGLVRGKGHEIGGRFETDVFKFSVTFWWLDLDSELSFVGDTNSVEPKGGTKRDGIELIAFWQPADWLALDAVYTRTDARFRDPAPEGGQYVDGAIEEASQFGITINHGSWDLSSRVRHMGPYALLPDNGERADSVISLNLRVARQFRRYSVYGEILNVTDEAGKDIVYFYETNVAGLGPQEGRVSRVKEPRTYRVGVKLNI